MFRVFFIYILPFVLPLCIYVIWAKKTNKRDIPYVSLIFIGLVLLGVVSGGLALWEGYSPEAKYVAPKLEQGKIVPASMEVK